MLSRIDTLLTAMMEHEKPDALRIQNFVKVHAYAGLIGRMEHLPDPLQETLEAAAIVHDIGIHPAEQKYGSSAGNLQELEGPPLARALLQSLGWDPAQVERIAWLVGHHHTYTAIDGLDYQILVEADFLVNLQENHTGPEEQASVYRKIFRTEGGKQLFRTMFASELPA